MISSVQLSPKYSNGLISTSPWQAEQGYNVGLKCMFLSVSKKNYTREHDIQCAALCKVFKWAHIQQPMVTRTGLECRLERHVAKHVQENYTREHDMKCAAPSKLIKWAHIHQPMASRTGLQCRLEMHVPKRVQEKLHPWTWYPVCRSVQSIQMGSYPAAHGNKNRVRM